MTGAEAWSLVAPIIAAHSVHYPGAGLNDLDEAYLLVFGGLQLHDSWVAHGKPEEWREKPHESKKRKSKA